MDRDEALKLLQSDIQFDPSQTGVQTMPPIGRPQEPVTFSKPTAEKSQERFREEHAQPGVPLDVESGVPTWQRLMLEARRSRENQIKYLEDNYGQDNIRMTRDGELFVKIPDPESAGKKKELLVFPHGKMTASDLLNLSVAMPEVAGWVAGEKLATKIPGMITAGGKESRGLLPAAARLGAGAVGAETAGAVTKDIPANIYDFQALNLPEVLKGRGEQAAADVGVGAAINTTRNLFNFARSPFWPFRGEIADIGEEGQQWAERRSGSRMPSTVGERTAVPFAMRSEAFVEKEPGGSGPLLKIHAQQEAYLRDLQRLLMGTRPPLDEEVGQRAINEIQSKIQPVVQGEAARRGALQSSTQSSLEGIVSGLTYPDRQVYKNALGEEIRSGVVARRDAEKAEADRLYNAVRSAPGGTGKVFNGQPLQQRFEDILQNLPSAEETITKPSTLLGPTGQPAFTTTSTRQSLLERWPPDKLLARLREITSLKDPKFALSDLQQMRRDIYDDISRGEGKPELGVHYLSEIGDAITSFMKDSINALPSGDLKTALQAADKHYREKVVPFNRLGLTELFRAANEPGFVASDQVLNRVISGGDMNRNWNLMKETLGQTSPTFQKMRRALADNLIEPTRDIGDGTLNAKEIVQNLYKLQREHREIYDEVFSPKDREFIRNARMLSYAQGDKVDASELQELLRSPDPNAPKLKALIDAEAKKKDLYKNNLLKAIGDGTVDETTLRPIEFVNRLLSDKGFSVEDTKKLMSLVQGNPALTDELRQKTFEKIFREAARNATADDLPKIIAGDPTHILSGVSLGKAIKDPTLNAKLQVLLGKYGFEDLTGYIKLTAPLEKKEEAYALAGGLAAGSRVGQFERVLEGKGGLLRFAGNTARSFVFSWLLSNPASRWYLGEPVGANPFSRFYAKNMPLELEDARKVAAKILTSPPFLQAVAKQYPGVTGARFINNLRQSISQSVTGEQQQQGPTSLGPAAQPMTREQRREFLNQL